MSVKPRSLLTILTGKLDGAVYKIWQDHIERVNHEGLCLVVIPGVHP